MMERGYFAGNRSVPGAGGSLQSRPVRCVILSALTLVLLLSVGYASDPPVRRGETRLAPARGAEAGDRYEAQDQGPRLGDLARRGDSPEESASGGGSYFGEYFRVLGGVVLVAALIVASLHFLRRFYPGANLGGDPRLLEVLARRVLSPKHQLVVVRLGERALVLGVAPDRIDKITELTDPREVISLASAPTFTEELADGEARYLDGLQGVEPQTDLSPYQREIDRLKRMVSNWRLTASRGSSR